MEENVVHVMTVQIQAPLFILGSRILPCVIKLEEKLKLQRQKQLCCISFVRTVTVPFGRPESC